MNALVRRDPTLTLFATLTTTPHDRAAELVHKVAAHHGVAWTPSDPPKFGANALRANDKIYAALTRSRCWLLKLPPARIAELPAWKRAVRFESGGRVMNGWVTLTPEQAGDWVALSTEARAFLTGQAKSKRKSR